MRKIYILVKVNYYAEVLLLDVFDTLEEAQLEMKTDFLCEKNCMKEDETLDCESIDEMTAYVGAYADCQETYSWEIFEREIPKEV
jgi:hypothetical protein